MDLGIQGKRALVCASSRGLGRGCAEALAAAGVHLILNGRDADVLAITAADFRQRFQIEVQEIAADITTDEGRESVLSQAVDIDILVNNAGGPPPGSWTDWQRDDFQQALDSNLLTPIFLMQALLPRMVEQGWGRIVNITSGAVRSPIPALGLSNMARTGLTGFAAGLSRQVAGSGVTINNLLPGLHATDRLQVLDGHEAALRGCPIEEVRAERLRSIPAGRYGTAQEFGAACAWLCSVHAGFVVGQNMVLDGGQVNATL